MSSNDLLSKRRVTHINPDVSITEITSPTRLGKSEKLLKKQFRYELTSDLSEGSLLKGQSVEWKANFNQPLENLIYPSLQRFDFGKYYKKKEIHEKMHGHYESPIFKKSLNKENSFKVSPPSFKAQLDPIETSFDENIMFVNSPTWSAKLRPSNIESPYHEKKNIYQTSYEEINVEGEKYLREKLKTNYLKKLQHDELEKEKKKEHESDELFLRSHRKKNLSVSPLALASADQLYATLVNRKIGKGALARRQSKLNKISVEEEVYNGQKAQVINKISKEYDHLLDGVIFYRMRNELNKMDMEEKDTLVRHKMEFANHKSSRRFSNTFSSRLATRKASGSYKNLTTTEMNVMLNEDSNLVSLSELSNLKDIPEMKFGRVKRALDGKYNGIDQSNLHRPSSSKLDRQNLPSPAISLRTAQDKLLLLQLEAGILPESFIKSDEKSGDITVDLSNYGIGDERGLCLGKSLSELPHLSNLGLSENRLTSASLPTIIESFNYDHLLTVDLSFNLVHDAGAKAISTFFRNKTALQFLDISNCELDCTDIKNMCVNLSMIDNHLEHFLLSCNKISGEGASALCLFLSSKNCKVTNLDLSWNTIGEVGAVEFSNALPRFNSLVSLNLASNGLGDDGAQRFIESVSQNSIIEDINLSQNSICDATCFVVSKVLPAHSSMRRLDLSLNPLGEAGARSIFRTILRGLRCFVIMRNCTYADDPKIFNNTYPTLANPYVLDLSVPYKAAVFSELLIKFVENPLNCYFENLVYKESPKSAESSLNLVVQNGQVWNKATNDIWIQPSTGTIKFNFHQNAFVPTIDNAINESSLDILQIIVENGKTDMDRKMWLYLICQDLYFTTLQAQNMIDRFTKKKVIGTGGLSKLDIIKSLWKFLLDTNNMFDFLFDNADESQRKDLIYALTIKRYKFNWANPTAHWRLNLDDKIERSIMMQIIAINNSESDFSKNRSGRGDTSQKGNWYNFRNETYTVNKETKEITIDKEFLKNLPTTGTIEFDYVSTTRPISLKEQQQVGHKTTLETVRLVTEDEFYDFTEKLGLSSRQKVPYSAAIFTLMDLQLASAKYYFLVKHVQTILDAFTDDWEIHSKVVICLFSRIKDLHRIDILLRNLDRRAQQDIIKRIGCLNLINPLKISFDYVFCLKYLDNRILLISLMELASIESADQIIEDPTTELPIATLYGSYTRALNETRPETMKFTFSDFGVRTNNVSWSSRKDLIKKFLVGTQPIDDSMYQVISLHKELESAGKLSSGPIDLQYANYLKSLNNNASRTEKSTQKMIGLMRNAAGLKKKP